MAFFVPLLVSIGGGAVGAGAAAGAAVGLSATAGAAIAGGLTVAGVVSDVSAAYQQHAAGQVANAEYKLQANQAGDAARKREIERRRDLLTALATRNAAAGAGGIGTGGSQAALAQADINQAYNDLLADRVNTGTQQRIFRARGANAQKIGNTQALTTLFNTATTAYKKLG